MTLLDLGREWCAVHALDLLPGDCVIRRGRRGPVVQSVRKGDGGMYYVSYCEGRGGQWVHWNHPFCVERRRSDD